MRHLYCVMEHKVLVAQSSLTLCDPGDSHTSLLQGMLPTQGSNLSVVHCRRILYPLSHHGSPPTLHYITL